jgi:hypothetical protein
MTDAGETCNGRRRRSNLVRTLRQKDRVQMELWKDRKAAPTG